uniref:Uncharacterized protein n=1 Tax=uncultured bacterium contig00160 TaxID=1181593 RepID=A0A806KP39_9BACT|nr:hypothetical protein [uncultured bacterium contig00160]
MKNGVQAEMIKTENMIAGLRGDMIDRTVTANMAVNVMVIDMAERGW